MDDKLLLEELLDLADRLSIETRREGLEGQGGGLCTLRGKKVLFVDTAAALGDQIASTAEALASLEEVENTYLLPQVRQVLDTYRQNL